MPACAAATASCPAGGTDRCADAAGGQDDSLEQAWTTWITPLEARQLQQRIARAAAAAKTRVEFFTVVRGEDAS